MPRRLCRRGDCVGAWLMNSTANWLYYVQQALREGRLKINPMT